jgi:hypothetical protein
MMRRFDMSFVRLNGRAIEARALDFGLPLSLSELSDTYTALL